MVIQNQLTINFKELWRGMGFLLQKRHSFQEYMSQILAINDIIFIIILNTYLRVCKSLL